MTRQQLVLISGILIAVLPFLGIPLSFKRILFVLGGLFIAFLGYTLHKRAHPHTPTSYVENSREEIAPYIPEVPEQSETDTFSVPLAREEYNEEE